MNPFILPAMGLIVRLLFFYKDGFGIKLPTKVDMPLNKENLTLNKETKQTTVGILHWICVSGSVVVWLFIALTFSAGRIGEQRKKKKKN